MMNSKMRFSASPIKTSLSINRGLCVLIVVALLLGTAHRLPALIQEGSPTPTEATNKPKSAPTKHKASNSSDSSPVRRFEGTWRSTGSSKNQYGTTVSRTMVIVIKNSTADLTIEQTSTLASGKKWNDFPAPYNSISPIYRKLYRKSAEVKTEGSNLRIRWQDAKVVDWSPRTIPLNLIAKGVDKPIHEILCILSGQQLIVTAAGSGHSATYTRVR